MCLLCQCKSDRPVQQIDPVKVTIDESFFDAIGHPGPWSDSSLLLILQKDTALTSIVSRVILNAVDTIDAFNLYSAYFNDPFRKRLKDTLQSIFKDSDWKKEIASAFARYHLSFPTRDIPVIHTLMTDFNYGIFLFKNASGHDALGIGKEMFLGNPAWYDPLSISNSNFSSYLNRTFNVAHLPSKLMSALAMDVIKPPVTNRVLDNILYEGKKLYFVKRWLPDVHDTILLEYTPEQLTWVKENELDIWRYLLADKLIYKTSGKEVANLTQPSPHSQGMPPGAPGRAANFIGLRIIESMMKKNPITDQALADLLDGDAILRLAKYNPR